MPTLTLAFLLGIMLIQQLPELPNPYWLMACVIALCVCAWKRVWFLLFFMLGIICATVIAMDRLNDRLPKSLEGKELQVTGTVISLPKQQPRRVSFDFQIDSSAEKIPKKIHLSWYNATQTVKAGQRWQFTVKLKRPHGMLNPAGFDYETWLFSQNIGATGYIRKENPLLLSTNSAFYHINGWRQAISDRLTRLLPHSNHAALIKALSIGDGNEITEAQWQVFRKTGTIHLIVISGSHISLVAGFVFLLMRKCWAKMGILTISPPTAAAFSALITAFFYSALAGFSVPTQRALVMVAVVMLGVIYQRHINPLNSLSLALFLVLLLDPIAVLSPGFWLSFVAVLILIYCSSNRLGKLPYFFPLVSIHFVMTAALAPLLLFYFQQFTLISPLANLVAIPAIEFIAVPFILISLPLIFLQPFLASKLLLLIAQGLHWLYWLLNELAKLPFACVNYPEPQGWAMLLAMGGMLLWLAPKGFPARWLAVPLCFPLFFVKAEKIQPGELILTLLDVGQGLSAVIQTEKHLLVFDTGAKLSADFDMGKAVLVPFLTQIGANKVDRLVISHGDNDHIGGAQSLLTEIKTAEIDTSVPQLFPHYSAKPCLAGQQWQWDQVMFSFLSPKQQPFMSENDNSCVLKIQSPHGSILLTGDIEATAEQQLRNDFGKTLKSEVLIAPHHGSKTSSTADFLAAVKPQLILIPAAYKNRYHLPHPTILQRYDNAQINWLMTGTAGAITVKITAAGLNTFAYRPAQAKYWHDK